MKYFLKTIPTLVLASLVALFAYSTASGQATIVVQNADAAGVGFNDATPAAPVGGNSGTTVGQQRLIVFQAAANIWGATLTSTPTITINASWAALPCTANGGTLGSAGNSGNIWRDFAGAVPGFWYGNALANAMSGTDRNGASPEINATFNLSLGTTGCLESAHWYYGLDNNHGNAGIDLLSVVLHEFAHGLGFQTYTNSSTGAQAGSQQGGFFPSIYDRFLLDDTSAKTWPQMTDAERAASATNNGKLVWNGPQVLNDATHGVLTGPPRLKINSPAAIAGNYQIGTADFGPSLTPSGVTGSVIQTSPTDGCSTIGTLLTGKIALIDRGSCTFVTKATNAQNAGAIGVIIVDNVSNTTPPGMGGGPNNTITIPTISVTQADGNTIKAQLGAGVNAMLLLDLSQLAGTDTAGRPMLYAPAQFASGSSVSHWDLSLFPNQVMEPNISGDLFHSVTPPRDLTFSLLKDIGWRFNPSAAPTLLVEEGTTNTAAAEDSVTHVRGPFSVLTTHNFTADGHTRIVFFTTDLQLNTSDNLSVLSVAANGIPLTVEAAGPSNSLAGTSYVIVRLPDLPQGNYALTVTLRGVNSTNAPTITIQ